jgi:glycosyltransferase involved in cell wall biosynthesis
MPMREHGVAPKVSIIICTYNRAALLIKTLHSLVSLENLAQAEIIVVDNRSKDDTAPLVKTFIENHQLIMDIRYIFEPVQGLSAARNTGILASKSSLIAFLDDDAIPCRTWITTIVSTFEEKPQVMAMGGKIAPIFESERPDWLIKPFELPYTIMDLGNRIKEYPGRLHPYGANMAMRKLVFDISLFPLELGRKGDSLLSGEETWLFEKIRQEGTVILYHPEMAVDHFVPKSRLTEDWILKRYYSQGLSNAMKSEGLKDHVVLLGVTGAKVLYIMADSVLSRSRGKKLLNKCRLESIRGTLHMIWNRKRESAAG